MQAELNRFFRMLRIKWFFDGKPATSSELEKVFYVNSSWEPPKAGKEVEDLIRNIQTKFDKWNPPRFISDNLNRDDRKLLKDIGENNNVVYKWEDKGPSVTKMNKVKYMQVKLN